MRKPEALGVEPEASGFVWRRIITIAALGCDRTVLIIKHPCYPFITHHPAITLPSLSLAASSKSSMPTAAA